MTDEDLTNLVDKIAAASCYGGLDSSTMYGEFALDVAKAVREECAKLAEYFVWFEQEDCSPDEGNVFIAHRIRVA